jgi:hypothetical protein
MFEKVNTLFKLPINEFQQNTIPSSLTTSYIYISPHPVTIPPRLPEERNSFLAPGQNISSNQCFGN